jgi:hypothetical protein
MLTHATYIPLLLLITLSSISRVSWSICWVARSVVSMAACGDERRSQKHDDELVFDLSARRLQADGRCDRRGSVGGCRSA